MKAHYITSKAELRSILGKISSGELSAQVAYESIDLTMTQNALALADWIEEKAKQIRIAAAK